MALTTDPITTQSRAWPLRVLPGSQMIDLHWPDAHLLPWHTHDRGQPHLYHLQVILEDRLGQQDRAEQIVGARTIGWLGAKPGRTQGPLLLNGNPLRMRGVNWVPSDLLAGAKDEEARIHEQLQLAVSAGVNALRVWGGGGRQNRRFYELCDELGLLLWQELPIACVFLDRMPKTNQFLALARRESRGIVRSLRAHPSLMLWSGGNEWGPRRNRKLAQVISRVVMEEDGSRRWLPSSPGPDDSHNWQVWHQKAPATVYGADPAPLLSEFGLAAPPDATTVRALTAEPDTWPMGSSWRRRNAEPDILWHYAYPFLEIDKDAATLEDFVLASQQAQARGLQAGIEAYRLRPETSGTYIWQWNEPWPAICWSILPFSGPPKAAYRQICRSYAPLTPLARITTEAIELWLVSDHLSSPGRCRLTASLNGTVIWQGTITPPINDRLKVTALPSMAHWLRDSPSPNNWRLELHLSGTNIDVVNDYQPIHWKPVPVATRLTRSVRERVKRYVLRW